MMQQSAQGASTGRVPQRSERRNGYVFVSKFALERREMSKNDHLVHSDGNIDRKRIASDSI